MWYSRCLLVNACLVLIANVARITHTSIDGYYKIEMNVRPSSTLAALAKFEILPSNCFGEGRLMVTPLMIIGSIGLSTRVSLAATFLLIGLRSSIVSGL